MPTKTDAINTQIGTRLSKEQAIWLTDFAKKNRISKSKAIELAVDFFIEDKKVRHELNKGFDLVLDKNDEFDVRFVELEQKLGTVMNNQKIIDNKLQKMMEVMGIIKRVTQ